jgi:hypothetical protein
MAPKWRDRFEVKPGRWVFVPTPESVDRGLEIKGLVERQWKPPSFFYHLRRGGHVAAVRAHVENKYFFRADIDDFFGRVGRSRVTRCLKNLFPFESARDMASVSVVKHPAHGRYILPYGFVQSPILASLALDKSKLGAYLHRLVRQPQFTVSVYVDDILVSSNDVGALSMVADVIIEQAEQSLFPIGTLKREGPCEAITAFNIELSQQSLNITAERIETFRESYFAATTESAKAGILGYIDAVNPKQSFL